MLCIIPMMGWRHVPTVVKVGKNEGKLFVKRSEGIGPQFRLPVRVGSTLSGIAQRLGLQRDITVMAIYPFVDSVTRAISLLPEFYPKLAGTRRVLNFHLTMAHNSFTVDSIIQLALIWIIMQFKKLPFHCNTK